jgi:hypothetical protein
MKYEVLTAALLKIQVFWDMMLCRCVCSSSPTEGTQHLLHEGQAIQEEFETSGTSRPVKQCHITQDFNLN